MAAARQKLMKESMAVVATMTRDWVPVSCWLMAPGDLLRPVRERRIVPLSTGGKDEFVAPGVSR